MTVPLAVVSACCATVTACATTPCSSGASSDAARSFDVMSSESDYYQLRVQQVNALTDGQQATALLWSLGRGLVTVVGE